MKTYLEKIRWLHQTKMYRNVEFHKFRRFDEINNHWDTYYYLDEIDFNRLVHPSKIDRRLFDL